jgi:hypothetical protein
MYSSLNFFAAHEVAAVLAGQIARPRPPAKRRDPAPCCAKLPGRGPLAAAEGPPVNETFAFRGRSRPLDQCKHKEAGARKPSGDKSGKSLAFTVL